MCECDDELTMPFTGHKPEKLQEVLKWLQESPLPVECFDAFLDEYATTRSIEDSVFRAQCEWDC
jgi:hypothetical protein